MKRFCEVAGCTNAPKSRGLCNKHYLRRKAHGSTDDPRPTPEQRFLAKVQADPQGCWLWTGSLAANGYATFSEGYQRFRAHRWAYERWVGPIPEGLVIDHVCRVRHCVNPKHLEPVTTRENLIRGKGPNARILAETCPHGHAWTEENTRWYGTGRRCRECIRRNKRKHWARHRDRINAQRRESRRGPVTVDPARDPT